MICKTCGVSSTHISQAKAVEIDRDELVERVHFFERERSEQWPANRADQYVPYQDQVRRAGL